MSDKRLYIVRVEFEYAVMANSKEEALCSGRLANHELNYSDVDISASLARSGCNEHKPMNWDDNECGVFKDPRNAHDVLTWDAAVAADKIAEAASAAKT